MVSTALPYPSPLQTEFWGTLTSSQCYSESELEMQISVLLLLSPKSSSHVTVTHNFRMSRSFITLSCYFPESKGVKVPWTAVVTVLCGLAVQWEKLLSRGFCWMNGEYWNRVEEHQSHREEPYIGVAAVTTSRRPCLIHGNLIFKSLLKHTHGRAPTSHPYQTQAEIVTAELKRPRRRLVVLVSMEKLYLMTKQKSVSGQKVIWLFLFRLVGTTQSNLIFHSMHSSNSCSPLI